MTAHILLVALGMCLVAPVAAAQNNARIVGRVVSGVEKAAVSAAEIDLYPGARRLTTSDDGRFRYDSVPAGIVMLVARRIGFLPESLTARVQPNEDLDVLLELERNAQELDTVDVTANEVPLAERKLAGFNERRRFGIGRFFDAETLEKEKNRKLGEFITSRTPGSKLIRSRTGTAAWLATNRIGGGLVLLGGSTLDNADINAGADPRACYPDVYVDGALVYTHGGRAPLFDINAYSTNDVMAVEFYISASQVPIQFNKTGAACGVVAVWTK